MSYYGKRFEYNGISSDDYNLYVASLTSSSGVESESLSKEVDVTSDKLPRGIEYIYGTQFNKNIEFKMSVIVVDCSRTSMYLDRELCREIEKWLFTSKKFAKLKIEDDELDTIYFNAILDKPEILYLGDKCIGYTFTVVTNSPYAYANSKKINQANITNTTMVINNATDKVGYTYPTISFKLNSGDSVSIINHSDNDREFKFTDISTDETITVDNKYQTISSSNDLSRSANFNKKFFRLLNGRNTIEIIGDLAELNIEYEICRVGVI